jgi:hypothetical protein
MINKEALKSIGPDVNIMPCEAMGWWSCRARVWGCAAFCRNRHTFGKQEHLITNLAIHVEGRVSFQMMEHCWRNHQGSFTVNRDALMFRL